MSGSKLKLVFGTDTSTSQILHISEVPSGKACNCICPQCGSALVAKKGKIKQHHFSHDNLDDCGLQNESFLHLYAKRVLARESTVTLPEFEIRHQGRAARLPGAKVQFDSIQDEAPLGSYRADAIATLRNHTLVIEFAVTHSCDDEKIAYINSIQQSAIELDLSQTPLDENLEIIDSYILHSSPRHWLCHSKENELKLKIDREIIAKHLEEKRISEWKERKDKERTHIIINGIIKNFKNDKEKSTERTLIFCRDSYKKCKTNYFVDEVNHKLPSQYVFLVPPHYWQSSIMNMFVIHRMENGLYDWSFSTKDVFSWISKKEFNYIRSCFRHFIPEDMKKAILDYDENFHTPYELIQMYLEKLEQDQVLFSHGYRFTARMLL